MQIAILSFDGFNEIDSFIALSILNRMRPMGWRAWITAPTDMVTSMNGVVVQAQKPLGFASEADAVIVGSGIHTRAFAADRALMDQLQIDPARQLIGSQCSGALILKALGLIEGVPACSDPQTRPVLEAAGVDVIEQGFIAHGNIASAGGCLASHYLAAWLILRGAGPAAVEDIITYVSPVGEAPDYVARVMAAVGRFALESGSV